MPKVTLEALDATLTAVHDLTKANGDKLDVVNGTVRGHGERLTAVEGHMPKGNARLMTTRDCDQIRARKFDRYVALFGPLVAVAFTWILFKFGG